MATFARYFPRDEENWEAWEDEDAVPPEVKKVVVYGIFAVII